MLRRFVSSRFVVAATASTASLLISRKFNGSAPSSAPSTVATTPASAEAAVANAAATAAKMASVPAKPSKAVFEEFLGNRLWNEIPAGKHIRVYVDSNTFAWVSMDRAGSSANALGEEFLNDLHAAFAITDKLIEEKKVRIVILASAKDNFCVGADIDMMYPVTDKALAEKASSEGQKFMDIVESKKYPVIAAINGLALGGGCELALACHHRLIASEKGSMGLPECLLGLLPGAGGCYRLPRLTGVKTALEWILTSAPQKAPKCKKVGAVDAVIPSQDRFPGEYRFLHGVRLWAGKLVDKPLKPAKRKNTSIINTLLEDNSVGRGVIHNMSIQSLNKKTNGKFLGHYKALETVLYAYTHPKEQALAFEAKQFSELLVTPEAKNQIALYYLDESMKKVEKKTGLAKDKISQVKKVGVIGAGVMGSGIVHYFANKGFPVAVKDITQEAVDKGLGMVQNEFKKNKRNDAATIEKKMKLVTGGITDEIFRDCDVIVEAAVEIMSVKKKLLQTLEESGILDGKKLFATNTSSLSLTELQGVSKYPETIVGMHFFNPVAKMPLVEVIKGKHTSQEAAACIFNLAVKTNKKPIIVGDAPGFLVNRILGVYMSEAGRLAVNDRADPHAIDKAMLKFGMPMGPFRLLDEVGLDVATHVGPVLEEGLKSNRFTVVGQINQMVKDDFLGKKNKKGFYRYEGEKAVGINTSITAKYLCATPDPSFPTQDIVDRCVLLMVNEACMILSEGVAASPEDVDIGMVWGTGFPPFRGGLLQYADHRGLPEIVKRLTELQEKTKDERFKPATLLADYAKNNKRFFPDRPFVPYVERNGFPEVKKF